MFRAGQTTTARQPGTAQAQAHPAQARPAHLKSKLDHLHDFNRAINSLSTHLVTTFPDDPLIFRTQKRIATATNELPEVVLGEVGPILYKYREQIYSGDLRFFLENEYEDHYANAVNQEKVDLCLYIIPKIKEAVRSLGPEDVKNYHKRITALLDSYVEYVTYGA